MAGNALLVLAAALTFGSLAVFKSWRLLAVVDANHELCTSGVYGIVRCAVTLLIACEIHRGRRRRC